MQFRVPQFIDIEDKIFGPFTFRQFIYLTGGAGLCFVVYKTLPIYIAILAIPPVAGLALALTFYKYNNRPFIVVLESAVKHFFKSKMFLWKKREIKPTPAPTPSPSSLQAGGEVSGTYTPEPKLTGSKLKELSWSLDILEMKNK